MKHCAWVPSCDNTSRSVQSPKERHVYSAPLLEVSWSQEQQGLSSHLFRVSEFGSGRVIREKGAFLTNDLGWVVGEWVSLLRMSWPCITSIIFSWLQWLTQILLWEGITSQCSGFRREAKEKKLPNQGFNIRPAVRIRSHWLLDPLSEGKTGTGNYLSSYPCGLFLASPVPCPKILNSPGAGLETSAPIGGISASWCRNSSPSD